VIVEEMMLVMDDDGASVQGAGTLRYTLGGALLTELALIGRVETKFRDHERSEGRSCGGGTAARPVTEVALPLVPTLPWVAVAIVLVSRLFGREPRR
jgi:hypothetical protein